jgi:hypothetical protein
VAQFLTFSHLRNQLDAPRDDYRKFNADFLIPYFYPFTAVAEAELVQRPKTSLRAEGCRDLQYTAFLNVTIHIIADSLQVTALVGDGLKILCEEGRYPTSDYGSCGASTGA